MSSGREVVVLCTTPSMFGACLEGVWRFEQRTFQSGSSEVKLVWAYQEVLN